MAKSAKPNDGPINLNNAQAVVASAVKSIISYKEQRKSINAKIASERAQCKEAGVPPAALDLAIRMKEMDPEQRAAHDEGYLIARKAIGLSIQRDLFETITEGVSPGVKAAQDEHVNEVKEKAAESGPKPEPEVAKSARKRSKPVPLTEALAEARERIGDGEKKGDPVQTEKPNPFDDDGEAGEGEPISEEGQRAIEAARARSAGTDATD